MSRTDMHPPAPCKIGFHNIDLLQTAEDAITFHGDPNEIIDSDFGRQYPIHLAAKNVHDNEKVAKALIRRGADVTKTNQIIYTALHVAICNRLRNITLYLLSEHSDVEAAEQLGNTPLHFAAENDSCVSIASNNEKQIYLVKLLLSRKAEVNSVDIFGETPLMKAIKSHSSFEVVELLLKAGADVRHRNKKGKHCLHLALDCEKWDTKLILELIRAGAPLFEINRCGLDGIQYLDCLGYHSLEEKVELLKEVIKTVYLMNPREDNAIKVDGFRGFAERCSTEAKRLDSLYVETNTSIRNFALSGSQSKRVWDLVLDALMDNPFSCPIYLDYIANQYERWYLMQRLFGLRVYVCSDLMHNAIARNRNSTLCDELLMKELLSLIISIGRSSRPL